MPEHSEGRHEETAEGLRRFDAETARRILHRAAEEQARMDTERLDSYSLEELEEIATEIGVSPEAVRAALRADQEPSAPARGLPGLVPEERPRGWLAWLESQLPASWSRRRKRVVLIGVGLGVFVLLLSIPGFGPVILWATVLSLLVIILLLLVGVLF
jgi:DNA-binding transcriptional ArsR family regulator